MKSNAKTTRKLNRRTAADWMIDFIVGALGILMVFPFYYMLIVSIGSYQSIQSADMYLWPTEIDLSAYKLVFSSKYFFSSFKVSLFITIVGTVLGLVVSVAGAYALSKKYLPGSRALFIFVLITMFFSGGTIPTYLVIQKVGLGNSVWAMILPTLTNGFNIILLKNFFEDIPPSLEESARIDGANDITILFQIVMPIAVPVIATILLFLAVGKWNEYFNAMLHIIDQNKKPLQLVLREILLDTTANLNATAQAEAGLSKQMYTPSLQMATVTIATLPILAIYPFLQKYFTKGITMGAVKE